MDVEMIRWISNKINKLLNNDEFLQKKDEFLQKKEDEFL